jgi:Phosphatidylserine decarboxylase
MKPRAHIDKNCRGTVALVLLLSAVAAFCLFYFVEIWWIEWPVLLALIWFCRWQIMFHRVPVRNSAGSDVNVTAVADGKIVAINRVYEKEWLKRDCLMTSIYMDFWDVHANFWPVDGKVAYSRYHPGKHFLAFKPKASDENEHTCTSVRTDYGVEVFFKQLAGGFARRIVCYAVPGLGVRAGEQCGIIKFGSRIDIYLPLEAEIKVAIGQQVRACETVIASLAGLKPSE